MRPQPNESSIKLPVTFDYRGGRGDNRKSNIITSLVLLAIAIVLTIFISRGEASLIAKIGIIGGAWLVVTLFVRFKILHEQVYSDAYETLKEVDNIPGTDSFWNIYEIDSEYPYICHFKNGISGIFIRLEKDVVVGKEDNILFKHYEAISEAYNLAGNSNINMCHIDYMDNVGNDSRLGLLYEGLNYCDNPDMKEAMLSMYSNLQEEMSLNYASFDVYLFTCRNKVDQLWYNVKMIVDRLLEGNYLSYRALDIDGVRTTCMAVFNLNEFSAIEACENIFNTSRYRGIVPISVEHADGSVDVLGKTQSQLREEAAERARKAEEAKHNKHKKRPPMKPPTQTTNSKPAVEEFKVETEEAVVDESAVQEQMSYTQDDVSVPGEEDMDMFDDFDNQDITSSEPTNISDSGTNTSASGSETPASGDDDLDLFGD